MRSSLRIATLGLTLLVGGLGALPAFGQNGPLTRDPAAALAWVRAHTDIDPATVVLLGDGYLFAATPLDAAHPEGPFRVREEVARPALVAALGGASARAEVAVDCRLHQSSIGAVQVYPAANLGGGAGVPVRGGAWLRAAPIDLVDLSGALCDPTAARPLAGATSEPAVPAPATPEPTPAAAPQPEASAEPELRPAIATPAPATAPATASGPAGSIVWVQLGAFVSEILAEAQWTKVLKAAPGLSDAAHRVEPVRKGATSMYRLLAGPYASRAEAQAACATARAGGLACLVR